MVSSQAIGESNRMYMESSHANNIGIAKFVNDCIYDTKTPAQVKNPKLRTTVNGFPVLLYINDEFYCAGNFNLDRYSTNSLGLTSDFKDALSYEISANTDTTAGAFVPWSPSSGKTEIEYLKSDFECRYPENRVQGDDNFAEIKRLVDWVGYATDDMFKEQFSQYLNLEYCIRYYLTVLMFSMVDNLGKNAMLNTWDGRIWYPTFYDCDTAVSLDNTGFMKFDVTAEMESGTFNTSNSNLWVKLRRVFANEIEQQYALMRQDRFTEENIMKYLYGEQISQIPESVYNLDTQHKYLDFGSQYLYACHGNREQQIRRWIRERLLYMDTMLNYTVSGADFITVRANKLGHVYFDIQVFSPQYFSIKFRDEPNNSGMITKKVNRGETVRFEYNLPTATDQEILLYHGRNIKDVGDMTNLQPTTMLLGNAKRLTRVICSSPNLINASISDCKLLQHIDLHGSTILGTGEGAQQTLNVSECENLKYINIYETQLTALYTNLNGGNIEEIYYPYSIQTVQVSNQPRLTSLGIPIYYTGAITNTDNIFANKLVTIDVANCDNLQTLVRNYCDYYTGNVPTFIGVSHATNFRLSNSLLNISKIDLSYCSNMQSMTLDSLYQLTEINFDDISAWDVTSSNLSDIIITNCPNVETLTFNQNTINGADSLGVAFATGLILDLSHLIKLKTIKSNVGIKGLKRLILPKTVTALVFDYPKDTTFSQTDSDIVDIWSVDASHTDDGFKGIDLLNMSAITDYSMGTLNNINNAINLNIKITNTFPYFNYFKTDNFFHPTGIVDISDYKGSLANLFKGVDLDKLDIICTKQLTQSNASYMFAYASCQDEAIINNLFRFMGQITDLSYMFYNAHISVAPRLPITTTNANYTFYGCSDMTKTPSNWNVGYLQTPTSDYCYTGCSSINMIDDLSGTIDDIPVTWGGFGRSFITYKGYEINATQTLDRPVDYAIAEGQTLLNHIPLTGETPVATNSKETFKIDEGLESSVLVKDGEYLECELEGLSLENIIPEKKLSPEMTQYKSQFEINENMNDKIVITETEFEKFMLKGETFNNILPDSGTTPILYNENTTGIFKTEDGLDSAILVKDGEMPHAVICGKSISNLWDDFEIGTRNTFVFEKTNNNTQKITCTVNSAYRVINTLNWHEMIAGKTYTALVEIFKNTGSDTQNLTQVRFCNGNVANDEIIDDKSVPYVTLSVGQTGVFKSRFIYNGLANVGIFNLSMISNEEFEYRITVIEGDYYDIIDTSFYGIGNVKMPILRTYTNNLLPTFNGTKTITKNNQIATVRYDESTGFFVYNSTYHPTYMAIDVTTGESWYQIVNGNNHPPKDGYIFEGSGTYKLCCEFHGFDNLSTNITVGLSVTYDDDSFKYESMYIRTNGTSHANQQSPYGWIDLTLTKGIKRVVFNIWYEGVSIENLKLSFQVVKGSEKQDFIPYKSTILSTPTNVLLRGTDTIQDELDLNTGILTRKLDEELNELNEYVIEEIDLSDQPKPYAYKNGHIQLTSSELIPPFEYQAQSSNNLVCDRLKSNTRYTLITDTLGTINFGGNEINITSNKQLITSGATKNIKVNSENTLLLEGNKLHLNPPYSQGMFYCSDLIVKTNGTSKQEIALNEIVNLKSLPDGTCDTYDMTTATWTQNTEIRPYQDGDENDDSVYTDMKNTIVALFPPIVMEYDSVLYPVEKPISYQNIEIISSGMKPTIEYQTRTENSFNVNKLEANTNYTLICDYTTSPTFYIGNKLVNITSHKQLVTSGTTTDIVYVGNAENIMLIKGNVTQIPIKGYFTGYCDVKNPIITNSKDTLSNLVEIPIVLRSNGDIKDTFNVMTGVLIQRVGSNHNILATPITQTVMVTKPYAYSGGTVTFSSDESQTLYPSIKYKVQSSNVFPCPNIKPLTDYTLYVKSENAGTFILGGGLSGTIKDKQVVRTTSRISDYNLRFMYDFGITEIMLLEGNTLECIINRPFKGLSNSTNATFNVSDGDSNTNTAMTSVPLRSIRNVKDTYNLITGEYTRNIGEREYQTGDELNVNVMTDMIRTQYQLDNPVTATVPIGWIFDLKSFFKKTNIFTTNSNIHPYLMFRLSITTLEMLTLYTDEIKRLNNDIVTLEEENLITMMAVTEMYESNVRSINSRSMFSIEMNPLSFVYAKLIAKGFKTLDEVPETLKYQVEMIMNQD